MFTLRECRPFFFCLVLLLPGAFSAADSSGAADGDAISAVVRLLEAEVSEPVILKWIEQSPLSGPLSPEDLIRLSDAGASDSLLESLLDRPVEVPSQTPASEAESPEPLTFAESSGTPESPEPPSLPAASPTTGGPVQASWLLRNNGPIGFDPEEGDHRRDLVVYLDGRLFARLDTIPSRSEGVERSSSIEPGPHSIRVTRDLHELTSKKRDSWTHEVRIFPEDFRFELSPGEDCLIEVRYKESSLSRTGPVTIRVTQNAEVVAESAGAGSSSDTWPRLCEAVNASFAPDKQDSFFARSQRKGCLPWSEMWPEEPTTAWQEALEIIRESGPTY